MDGPLDGLLWLYNQRAGAENLIKEANNDAVLTAHPSNRWRMNANWFQIVMLAYNPKPLLNLPHCNPLRCRRDAAEKVPAGSQARATLACVSKLGPNTCI